MENDNSEKDLLSSEWNDRHKYGYASNKDIVIAKVEEIEINNFRSFKNRKIKLGSNITVLVGRNGTMKTSLMGLIAHPFTSHAKDAFGRSLKTSIKDVFRLSTQYDEEKYKYSISLFSDKGEKIKENVEIYVDKKGGRHRVVVSGHEEGDGNFYYSTSFLNLSRLAPIIHTHAKSEVEPRLQLSKEEIAQQKDFYENVFPSTEYSGFEPVTDHVRKNTYGPCGKKAKYDFNTISSGEDNLGALFNRMLGFQRAFDKTNQNAGDGIFCIDEFESSLHPVAQVRLFKYLYSWSQKYNVQVVITTHSLYLVQYLYFEQKANMDAERIIVNFISKAQDSGDKNYPILKNVEYCVAYKELTFKKPEEVVEARKVNVFCEDDIAVDFIRKIIRERAILSAVSFHTNLDEDERNNGTEYSSLAKLCQNFSLLMHNSFAVFDPDVDNNCLRKIKNKDLYLRLPDPDNLAIERRIIYYIVSLPNGDNFFRYFDKEKESFLADIKDAGVKSLSLDDIFNEKVVSITHCKNWAKKDLKEFKKYVTYYCQNSLDSEEFKTQFVTRINEINKRQGVPMIGM